MERYIETKSFHSSIVGCVNPSPRKGIGALPGGPSGVCAFFQSVDKPSISRVSSRRWWDDNVLRTGVSRRRGSKVATTSLRIVARVGASSSASKTCWASGRSDDGYHKESS